jgi:hypothetical protein
MVFPLVFLICFTFSCQQSEEVAEEPAVDVETDVAAIKASLLTRLCPSITQKTQ